ncbi:hypothetical protein [Streptomyces phaeochromogenes]
MEAGISSTAYATGPRRPSRTGVWTYGKPRGENVPAVGRRGLAATAPTRSDVTAVA